MQYRLLPASPEDQAALEKLRRSVYQELFFATWGGWDEARHLRHFAACWDRGNISWVEVDGGRVGMIQRFERDDVLEVGEIQIQPSHQGRGIGAQVLKDTIARAHTHGKTVRLSTGLQNRRAFKLYERLGFQCISRTDTHFHMEFAPEQFRDPTR